MRADCSDPGNRQDTQVLLDNISVNVTQILEARSRHESPLASLSVVLHSLDAHKRYAANHARDAHDGEADAWYSPRGGTSD